MHISIADKEAAELSNIEELLLCNGKSLDDYPSMPIPEKDNIIDTLSQLILEELKYNKENERENSETMQ